MELTPYVESLRADLEAAAAAGTDATRETARLLVRRPRAGRAPVPRRRPVGDGRRGHRRRRARLGGDPHARPRAAGRRLRRARRPRPPRSSPRAPAAAPDADDDGATARVTLRLPESLKAQTEERAAAEGLSVNAWLVRAVHEAVHGGARLARARLGSTAPARPGPTAGAAAGAAAASPATDGPDHSAHPRPRPTAPVVLPSAPPHRGASMPTHRFPTPTPVSLSSSTTPGPSRSSPTPPAETHRRHQPATRTRSVVELTGSAASPIQPRRRHRLRHQRIDMVVHLPAGSTVEVDTAAASVTVRGPSPRSRSTSASALGDGRRGRRPVSRPSPASGSVRSPLGRRARSRSAAPPARSTSSGWAASARPPPPPGSITIGVADDDVSATSVSGRVAVREAHRGTVDLSSTSGSVEVGVRRGTLAWLDVSSVGGRTTSDLPTEDDAAGDRRAAAHRPGPQRERPASSVVPSGSPGADRACGHTPAAPCRAMRRR